MVDFDALAANAALLIRASRKGAMSKNAASEIAGKTVGIGGKYLQQISANNGYTERCSPKTRNRINRAVAAIRRKQDNAEPPRKRCRPEINYTNEKEYTQFVKLTPDERRAALLMYLSKRGKIVTIRPTGE